MTRADFIKQNGSNAVIGSLSSRLFPSVILAQGILETGNGNAVPGNNLFGIKADSSWGGKVISTSTTEYVNGTSINYPGTGKLYKTRSAAIAAGEREQTLFRAYNSPADSFTDHSNFLLNNPRYGNAGVFNATTPEAQAQALQDAGYATDPAYAGKLVSIINGSDLQSWDVKKKLCEQVLYS